MTGTIEFVDLGAGEFYLVTQTERNRLIFSYGDTELYDYLQRLAALETKVMIPLTLNTVDASTAFVGSGIKLTHKEQINVCN